MTTDLVVIPATAIHDTELDNRMIALWLHKRPERTRRTYQRAIIHFHIFVNKPFQEVTLQDLQDYIDTLDHLAPATQARIINTIKSFLAFAHRQGLLAVNVGVAVKAPKPTSSLSERFLNEGDVARILALEEHPRNHALLRLLYGGGLRAAEIASLCWRNLIERDLNEREKTGQVNVIGKGSKPRSVLLSAETWREVQTLRGSAGDDDPVFRSRKQANKGKMTLGMLTTWQIWHIVKTAAARAGVKMDELESKVSPHWLRHAHASHAIKRGAPITVVRDTLGHASIATTNKYAHSLPDESSATYLPV